MVLPVFTIVFAELLGYRQEFWEEDGDLSNSYETLKFTEYDKESKLFEHIHTLGWLSAATMYSVRKSLLRALHSTIQDFVTNTARSDYETELFTAVIMKWKDSVLVPFVQAALCHDKDAFLKEDWDNQLNLAVSEAFCNLRITEEMFDIITDYPDSETAVIELRDALYRFHTGMHYFSKRLTVELRASLRKRLLHPGAQTSQILDVYIATIKVLRLIDPTDTLLDQVARPIKAYLHQRNDTVRCIVTSLTDEQAGGDLYEELRRHDAKPLDHTGYGSNDDSDEDMGEPARNWRPKSKLVTSSSTKDAVARPTHKSDILSMLVGIYGSKELFVNEYRALLADKLLANLEYDTDREVHTLELLKLRFGEESMHQCEIMIKDIDDSKRINSNLRSTAAVALITKEREKRRGHEKEDMGSQLSDEFVVDASIVSHVFWPEMEKNDLKVYPTQVKDQLTQYSKEYAKLKNPRRLIWLEQLGTVELELYLDDETDGEEPTPKTFICSPLHATLISHFEDKEQWTSADLANETGVPEDMIMKKMSYWLNHHVVRVALSRGEDNALMYELVASSDPSFSPDKLSEAPFFVSNSEDDRPMEERGNLMAVYEKHVVEMISSVGAQNLSRIQELLQIHMESLDETYDKSLLQLATFLKSLCKSGRLEYGTDGKYRLKK